MRLFPVGLAITLALATAACGDDPVSYSDSIAINLKAKSSEVAAGVVLDDKGITTENGNPYGAFVADARAALHGADPARIEVSEVSILVGANSTGVTRLDEIFAGDVEVLFEMNDTNNTIPVAHVTDPAGAGPVALEVTYDSAAVSAVDLAKLIGGSFKVVLRGPAAPGFEAASADADLQVTLRFEAFAE